MAWKQYICLLRKPPEIIIPEDPEIPNDPRRKSLPNVPVCRCKNFVRARKRTVARRRKRPNVAGMKFEIYSLSATDGFRWRVIKTGPVASVLIVIVAQSGHAYVTRDAAQADYDAFIKWASAPPAVSTPPAQS